MDANVLGELVKVLPDWTNRLNELSSKFPQQTGIVAPVDPTPPEKPKDLLKPMAAVKPRSISSLISNEDSPPKEEKKKVVEAAPARDKTDSGAKKLNQKPSQNRARFSSLTSPDIFYDGDSQKCLFDCWTALNSSRGQLRKEMMLYKRKRIMALPTAGFDYSDSDSDEEEEEEETEEQREKRIAEEKRKMEIEKRKAAEDKKRSEILEFIDGKLDRAARACECAATLWLKGDGCTGHIVFINDRIQEAIERVQEELDKQVVDEGFDEKEDASDDSEELPHKLPVSGPAAARLARMRALGLTS